MNEPVPRVRTLRKSLSWNLRVGGNGAGGWAESPASERWDPAFAAASWGSDGAGRPDEDGRLVACECATVAAMISVWRERDGGRGRRREAERG